MAKATRTVVPPAKPVVTVTLELNEDEAYYLRALLGTMNGSIPRSVGLDTNISHNIYKALEGMVEYDLWDERLSNLRTALRKHF